MLVYFYCLSMKDPSALVMSEATSFTICRFFVLVVSNRDHGSQTWTGNEQSAYLFLHKFLVGSRHLGAAQAPVANAFVSVATGKVLKSVGNTRNYRCRVVGCRRQCKV